MISALPRRQGHGTIHPIFRAPGGHRLSGDRRVRPVRRPARLYGGGPARRRCQRGPGAGAVRHQKLRLHLPRQPNHRQPGSRTFKKGGHPLRPAHSGRHPGRRQAAAPAQGELRLSRGAVPLRTAAALRRDAVHGRCMSPRRTPPKPPWPRARRSTPSGTYNSWSATSPARSPSPPPPSGRPGRPPSTAPTWPR